MKVAFVTFIYPKATSFFDLFILSLRTQTNQQFDLLVFNDGCDTENLGLFYSLGNRVRIIDNNNSSIAMNRLQALQWLLNSEYDAFIIGDIDDQFAINRVEVSRKLLKQDSFVVNELIIVNQQGEIVENQLLSDIIEDSSTISLEMIKEFNLIGFSHISIQKSRLKCLVDIHLAEQTVAVDWTIFSYLLVCGHAYFTNETHTKYIMHNNNVALNINRNIEGFLNIIDVKIQYYKNTKSLSSFHLQEFINLSELKTEIQTNKYLQEKISKRKFQPLFPWWSQIPRSEVLKHELSV